MESVEGTEIVCCPDARCRQQLRIPAGETLLVTCPSCQASFTHRPPATGRRCLSQEWQMKSWTLGELMVVISRESMMLLKRQAPNTFANLQRKQDWDAFLEFLKVLFNLVDRVGALYVPVNEYLQFLDSVEDAVIDHMNNSFRKQAGAEYDDTPLKISVAAAFDAAQKFYHPYRFMITEESPEKERYLKAFGEAVAAAVGATANRMIVTSASMCAVSSIAAIKALLESTEGRTPAVSGTA
jgi:hypothetical protein